MGNSAIDDFGATVNTAHLSNRMKKTRLSITRTARDLTTNLGFSGFTIEQLCEQVGISRRTFFNYFPTKLDAVFGQATDEIPEGALERFRAARPAGITGISPTLLADFVAFALEQLTFDEQSLLSTHGFFSALHREPELLQRVIQLGPKQEAFVLNLIADREGVDPEHPALAVLLHTVRFATMKAVDLYLAGSGERTLSEEFLDIMSTAQTLLGHPLTLPTT